MQKISKTIATLSFIGYSPLAPGTMASLAGVLVYFLIGKNALIYYPLTVLFLILGFWSSSRAEKYFSKKDPGQIVIDEFSATLLVYFFIPFNPKFLIAGFLLFRVFDVFKIPPMRKLQAFPAGSGIMLDDIASAILANLVLQMLRFMPLPI